MTYEEAQAAMETALTTYRTQMDAITKEHNDAVKKILADVKARRIDEIKKSLQNHG